MVSQRQQRLCGPGCGVIRRAASVGIVGAHWHGAVRESQAGLWHWLAPHPHWTPGQRSPQEVSSYAIDDGERLLLFDPPAVPVALHALAGNVSGVV